VDAAVERHRFPFAVSSRISVRRISVSDLPKLTNFRMLSAAQLILHRTISVRELVRAR
jgi:hypothetical protein